MPAYHKEIRRLTLEKFDDGSCIVEQEDGSYIIAKIPERIPIDRKSVPRVYDAERYYWTNFLHREDESTVDKLDDLYERRNKRRDSA